MKLQRNVSQIQKNIANARFENSGGMLAQANVESTNRLVGGLEQFKQAHFEVEENKEAQKVIDANNLYQTRVNELKKDIAQNYTYASAEEADKVFKEREAAIRAETLENAGLKYKKGYRLFDNMANEHFQRGLDFLSSHQIQEHKKNEAAKDENSYNLCAEAINEDGTVEGFSKFREEEINKLKVKYGQEGEEAFSLRVKEFDKRLFEDTIYTKLMAGDIEGAKALAALAENTLDDKTYQNIKKYVNDFNIMKIQKENQNIDIRQSSNKGYKEIKDIIPNVEKKVNNTITQKENIKEKVKTQQEYLNMLAEARANPDFNPKDLLEVQFNKFGISKEPPKEFLELRERFMKPDVPRESDKKTFFDLRQKQAAGELTEQDINQAFDNNMLSLPDFTKFNNAVYSGVLKQDDLASNNADRKLFAGADDVFNQPYLQIAKQEFVLSALDKVDEEGLTGAKRTERFNELLNNKKQELSQQTAAYAPLKKDFFQALAPWGKMGEAVMTSIQQGLGSNATTAKVTAESKNIDRLLKNYAHVGSREKFTELVKQGQPVSLAKVKAIIAQSIYTGQQKK